MSFQITILGSSGAMPAYGRFPSAQLVEIQNEHFLVDCGEGTQMQLLRFQQNLHRINHILISHLHGDHFLGLMGLIFTMHLNRRTNDLHIYSQPGLDEIIITQLRYTRSVPHFKLIFHPLQSHSPEIIYEDKHLTIETIPLVHKLECAGFLFREKPKPRRIIKETLPPDLKLQELAALKRGEDILNEDGSIRYKNKDLTNSPRKSRSYAYCSDTQFHKPLCQQIKNIDVLYHESTFMQVDVDKAKETKHSTAAEAAQIAREANVSKLIIGHFSARYRELEPLWNEAKSVFSNTHLAEDGKTYHIEE